MKSYISSVTVLDEFNEFYSDGEMCSCERKLINCMEAGFDKIPPNLPVQVSELVLAENKIKLEPDSLNKYQNLRYL